MQQTSQADDPAGVLRRPRRARSRWRIGVGAAMVLVIAAAVVAVLLAGTRASGRTEVLAPAGGVTAAGPSGAPSSAGGNATPEPSSSPGEVLYVHVAGAVAAPGLYLLDPGARVADALAAAGGFTEPAERAAVNLARRLVDGEQILVPERGAAVVPGGTAPAAGGAAAAGGIVSLSTATAAQLEELPEIGPAMAAKIIAYREEHGPFTSVDQLLEVPGVGEKTLEAFREQVAP